MLPIADDFKAASESNSATTAAKFFEGWLHAHGVKEVVVKDNVVAVPAAAVKMSGVAKDASEGGVAKAVELTATVDLPDGRKIIDYLVGVGDSFDSATDESLSNFCLTTFHPVYAAFIDNKDPHVDRQTWEIDGKRTAYVGDVGFRGTKSEQISDLVASKYKAALCTAKMDGRAHWSKLVVAMMDGKVNTCEVTFDNEAAPALTEMMSKVDWPKQKGFLMFKQFVVIGPKQ